MIHVFCHSSISDHFSGLQSLAAREARKHAHVHGAGQIGLLAAVALFGVDYFTSYFYATGEMMSALHPYGLQKYAYIAVVVIALANLVFGALYMYSLGVFNEGGGSYTASMRYLRPTLSLIVAVTLIQDYVLTIVVSALVRRRPTALDPERLRHALVLALCHRRGAGRRHLVSHHSRAGRVGAGRLHAAGHLRHADRDDGRRPVHRPLSRACRRCLPPKRRKPSRSARRCCTC